MVAGHSRQFTPGGLPDNCETHCVSGNRTHDLPIVSPTRYQLCHRDQMVRIFRLFDFLNTRCIRSSTSSCSLSSWFTSLCTHHLITVITFALTTYHSPGLLLQTSNSSVSQILSSTVFLIPFGLPSLIINLDWTNWALALFVIVQAYFFLFRLVFGYMC